MESSLLTAFEGLLVLQNRDLSKLLRRCLHFLMEHFLLTELIVATSELCEAAAVLSELKLLSTVGAVVVDDEATAVLFISTCTSDFSEFYTCSH